MTTFTDLFSQNYDYNTRWTDEQKSQWTQDQALQSYQLQYASLLNNVQAQITQAQRDREYAVSLQNAFNVRYSQTMDLMEQQISANKEAVKYKQNLLEQNASIIEANYLNKYIAAASDQKDVLTYAAAKGGETKAAYAASGFAVGTGSSLDVVKNILDTTFKTGDNKYRQSLSEINSAMTQATSQRLEAALSGWSADQQASFLRKTTAMQLESQRPATVNSSYSSSFSTILG